MYTNPKVGCATGGVGHPSIRVHRLYKVVVSICSTLPIRTTSLFQLPQQMAEKPPIEDLCAPEANSLSATDSGSSRTDVASDYELTGIPLVLVITGLSLSIFLMSLDSSIISTAIPRITSEFNSTGDIGWYGSAYSFAMCALQPIAGKLFGSFPMKVNLSKTPGWKKKKKS